MNLTRWRNSHGFGVHSPFGFKIAKGVVSPGRNYSYYAEAEISRLAKKEHVPLEHAKHYIKFHRLLCILNIREAYSSIQLNKCMQLALKRAGVLTHKYRSVSKIPDIGAMTESSMHALYIFEDKVAGEIAEEILSTPGNVMMIYSSNPLATAQELKKYLQSGIIISGNLCTFAFSRIQTQPVCYQMDL